jgi:small subunit ribosomal protein S3
MVAKKAAKYIEMGKKLRSVLHFLLREIIKSGALGAEIVASGKIGQKGAKAKKLRVAAGYIPKSGEPARSIKVAHLHANTKSGIIGVFVRIVPPGTVFPDKKVTNVVLPKVIEHATEVANRAPASEAESESAQGGSPPRGAPGRGGPFRGGPNRGGFNRDGQGSRRPQRRRE